MSDDEGHLSWPRGVLLERGYFPGGYWQIITILDSLAAQQISMVVEYFEIQLQSINYCAALGALIFKISALLGPHPCILLLDGKVLDAPGK